MPFANAEIWINNDHIFIVTMIAYLKRCALAMPITPIAVFECDKTNVEKKTNIRKERHFFPNKLNTPYTPPPYTYP